MTDVKDIIFIAIILFAVGISLIIIVNVSHIINAKLLTQKVFNDSAAASSVLTHSDTASDQMDYVYLAFFIGFFIALIIFGYLVGGLPIFAPLYFFLVIIFTFVAVILQLVWTDIISQPNLAAGIVNLPITAFILSHLGLFTAVFGLAGIFAMFTKSDNIGY